MRLPLRFPTLRTKEVSLLKMDHNLNASPYSASATRQLHRGRLVNKLPSLAATKCTVYTKGLSNDDAKEGHHAHA